ncbi:MAG: hypothetical protein JWL96_4199 [Sphingomonas bacterium]|uniref:VOC family protein n=1 Tax=Sphingomonas bacterium TaxID=1895847 RepID=UPI00262BB52E|nr:VOC family protein [Sphingomonas bacterium]MDB5712129.1 hypothetical protein [Sphingomonas bacterium]
MTALIAGKAPNLQFSHFGISVREMDVMERFYTEVLGFTVTDRGELEDGLKLIFLSRDPADHHQIVLASGRPEGIPDNLVSPRYGASINQISFKMGDFADLREMHERLDAAGVTGQFPGNHGIAWSIYAPDPEGNNLEFFVDSEWYFPQPFLIPLDFSKSDDEILAETEAFSRDQPGFVPFSEWRAKVAERMTPFRPAAV